ncbi:DUF4168 domain-containing protein [Synechococcus sp. Nb3U1]|uniref:DUF4168 domain-containing protein n=1 Tax=Synechococcus sp. Nb3U1 TaxID=1914529 RepID=UPI001F33D6EC|nr:DUF4168 domain-containing protein [Synechococcus sp. Nb3U1]
MQSVAQKGLVGLIWACTWIPLLAVPLAVAQTPTPVVLADEQVTMYARIVLEMEPYRQESQQRSQATDDPASKDQIRRDFIRTASEIITRHGMSVPDYNRITLLIRSPEGQALQRRIEAEILRLQSEDP